MQLANRTPQLDAGDLVARNALVLEIEPAVIPGPLSVQSEFLRSRVLDFRAGSLRFYEAYASVSRSLTGEIRVYDRAKAPVLG